MFDVAIIGGAGHVGAPLSVSLALHGRKVLIVDPNERAVDQMLSGKFPYMEEGGDEALKRAKLTRENFRVARYCDLGDTPYIIICIGTPIDEFHNPKFKPIQDCVRSFIRPDKDNPTIILRSTVFPGTTERLRMDLQNLFSDQSIVFCPERSVQGRAIQEMEELPQIIGADSEDDFFKAKNLFDWSPWCVNMTSKEAEFAKLACNAYRYIQFAATNELCRMATEAGLDYGDIISGLRFGYKRAESLPSPGFAAGPCLMKDTMQLAAMGGFSLGHTATEINEGLPGWIVNQLRRKGTLPWSKVGILGMSFKAESDDTRDSLSFKLRKLLHFAGAEVLCSDEYATDPTFVSKEEIVEKCHIVIVAVPHKAYKDLKFRKDVQVINLWE